MDETTTTEPELCEWNPIAERAAYSDETNACQNEATMQVGVAPTKNWHLCAQCADYPAFRRLKKTPLVRH